MKDRKPAKPLQSRQEVFWKVKSWGRVNTQKPGWEKGPEVEGEWSDPAR
nr:hypothetical protein [Akkermansiaceae bacterium]